MWTSVAHVAVAHTWRQGLVDPSLRDPLVLFSFSTSAMEFPKWYRELVVSSFLSEITEQLIRIELKSEIWNRVLSGSHDYRTVCVKDQASVLLKHLFLNNVPRGYYEKPKETVLGNKIHRCIFYDCQTLQSFFFTTRALRPIHVGGIQRQY